MTEIRYDPKTPEICFEGHAGAGRAGADPVCAALSILMYTLASEEAHSAPFPPSSFSPTKRNSLAGVPEEAHSASKLCVEMADGFCRIRGGEQAVYEVIVAGLRLLATEKPEHVHLEVKG